MPAPVTVLRPRQTRVRVPVPAGDLVAVAVLVRQDLVEHHSPEVRSRPSSAGSMTKPDESGYGLLLVATLATTWGVRGWDGRQDGLGGFARR
ncbi:hypothetical protein AWI43_31340 [Streptomyces sp. WAC04657]|nr:hypothetical protein AWI43_31675 [Streptomyces sp. WAC04657]KYG51848.1 hypothetical protein AWI43_31340 [Streptomyces sp. WAC04657]